MINKDRIVPITRTDLLSFFAAIYNTMGNPITILTVEDGAVTLPAGASGAYLAVEPLKTLPETIGNGVTIYFVPAYDFEMTMTPVNDAPEFVANPGNLYKAVPEGVIQLDTGAGYTVA